NTSGPVLFLPPWNRVAVDFVVFLFIVGISLAMTARIAPLSFRVQTARKGWLVAGGAFLTLGGLLDLLWGIGWGRGDGFAFFLPAASLCFSLGIVLGGIGVRIAEPRQRFPGDAGRYRVFRD